MVNVTVTMIAEPLRTLAFSYAPGDKRAGLEALFALDGALGQVLRTTNEPMVGQMRLAWWREALERLDDAAPPGEPVLVGLATYVQQTGINGADLARLVEGWEPLLGEMNQSMIDAHATCRGALLFTLAGRILGTAPGDPVASAGEGWALADLAAHLSAPALAVLARDRARRLLDVASRAHWSRNGRSLGALALIARRDASETGGIGTVFRLGWHRLTGR